jgi:hypothetical protein
MGTCRIEVRSHNLSFKGVSLVFPNLIGGGAIYPQHTYIYTYDPIDGSEFAYRGGPSNILDAWGYPRAEGDVWQDSADYDAEDDDLRTTIYEDDYSCDKWRHSFKETTFRINAASVPYNLFGPNSNSVVTELLENAGLEPSRPTVKCSRNGLGAGIYNLLLGTPECGVTAPGWGTKILP